MKSFFGELKRRNVVRVAILYAVVGWLVLQIADLVIPALGIPDWGVSLAVVLVTLGFPIALVMAWAFEVTPEGLKRTHEVERGESRTHVTGRKLDLLIIGVLGAALLYGAFDLFVLRERGVLAPRVPAPVSGPSAVVSIAVLPFVDMSQAKDQEYLTDGISEELLNVLARVEGFKVTARTSAFAFKGRNEDLRTVGEKLGVEHILEGSVRKQGERIRVTAQLVKATDGYHLWSETYDRQLGDVFAIQDDIARQVVDAIRSTLASNASAGLTAKAPQPPPTKNIEAYTHFLRGQQFLRSRERAGMESALAEFERAVALDLNFARAHVGIGTSLVLLATYGYKDLAGVEARAAAEFDRAIALEPGLPDAYAGQGLLLDVQGRGRGTTEIVPLFERAVAGNPSDSQSLVWLASTYGIDARAEDERRTMERAYSVDPLHPLVIANYAYTSQRFGRPDLATRLVSEMAALYPESAGLYRMRGLLAESDGRFDEAIRWGSAGAKHHPEDAVICDALAWYWSSVGDAERGKRHAARCRSVTPAFAVSTEVFVRLNAGDLDDAASLLQSADQRNDADRYLHMARAYHLLLRGDEARALESLLLFAPVLRTPSPPMGSGAPFDVAPWAAYLFRETGDVSQARRITEAFERAVDAYWQPAEGREPAFPLVIRAQMAAVVGDRAALLRLLSRYHEHGGILPVFIPREPWFQAHKNDPAIADLFAKAAVRREEARQRLRAEGL